MIGQFLPPPIRRVVKSVAEIALPVLETFTGFHTARGDYLPNRFRILLGNYEHDDLQLMAPLVHRAKMIFDVGANVGYVTRFLAQTAKPDARIFSFEPNPIIFPILERNVARFSNVRAFKFGLSNFDAEMPLFVAGNDHSVGSFSTGYPATHAAYQNRGAVWSVLAQLVHGDQFAQREQLQSLDALKIDVEGWELSVLDGLEQTIARSPDISIFCEYNAAAQKCADRAPDELPAWLIDRGFSLSVNVGGSLCDLPGNAADAVAALPTNTEYPTLFARRR